jgi:hypothetical protein
MIPVMIVAVFRSNEAEVDRFVDVGGSAFIQHRCFVMMKSDATVRRYGDMMRGGEQTN